MTIYRLYTEDKPNLAGIVTRHFDGATILRGEGVFRGVREQSAVIEIIDPGPTGATPELALEAGRATGARLVALADDIRQTNLQASVLLTVAPIAVVEIGAASGSEVAGSVDGAPVVFPGVSSGLTH